jgi:hypothetical protein
MTTVYVFGLTTLELPRLVIKGHHIDFIDLDGVHAAVERGCERPSLSEAALRSQHEIVMSIFERADDLLPVRFGAWIEERDLADFIRTRRDAIQRTMDLVRGRVQMTVRFRALPSDASHCDTSADRASGTSYLQARRRAARAMPAEAALVSAAVQDLVVAELTSPPSQRSAASLYHLVDRHRIAPYTAATSRFAAAAVSVSGPWPAFAFAADAWP